MTYTYDGYGRVTGVAENGTTTKTVIKKGKEDDGTFTYAVYSTYEGSNLDDPSKWAWMESFETQSEASSYITKQGRKA